MLPFLAEDTPRQHNADEGTRHNTDETGPRRRDNKHRRDNKRRRHKADDTRQGKRGVGFNLSCGLALQPVEEVFPLAGRAHSKALTGEGATGSCGRCYNAIARELHVSVLLVVLISIVVVLGVRVLGVLGGAASGSGSRRSRRSRRPKIAATKRWRPLVSPSPPRLAQSGQYFYPISHRAKHILSIRPSPHQVHDHQTKHH